MSLLGLQHLVPPETDPPPDVWSSGRNDDRGQFHPSSETGIEAQGTTLLRPRISSEKLWSKL
jgi:hypothetical protein